MLCFTIYTKAQNMIVKKGGNTIVPKVIKISDIIDIDVEFELQIRYN